ERWDMPQLGLFQLTAHGGDRFRLLSSQVAPNGLMSGTIERLAPDVPAAQVDPALRQVLKVIIERVGEANFPAPIALDDSSWVGFRLAEILPLDLHEKQDLLEIRDAGERLARLREVLLKNGLVVGNDDEPRGDERR